MGLRKFTIVIDEKYTEDVTMAFIRFAESFSFENVEDQPGFDLGEVSASDFQKLTTVKPHNRRKHRSPGYKHARGNAYRLLLEKVRRLESFTQSDATMWMVAGGYAPGSVYSTIQTLILDGYVHKGEKEGGKAIIYYPTDMARQSEDKAA